MLTHTSFVPAQTVTTTSSVRRRKAGCMQEAAMSAVTTAFSDALDMGLLVARSGGRRKGRHPGVVRASMLAV